MGVSVDDGQLAGKLGELGERVSRLETEIKVALEGVGNFRTYQGESRESWAWLKSKLESEEAAKLQKEKDDASVKNDAEKAEKRKDRKWNLRVAAFLAFISLLELFHGCKSPKISFSIPPQGSQVQQPTTDAGGPVISNVDPAKPH